MSLALVRKEDPDAEHEQLIQDCYQRWMNDAATWSELYELMMKSL